MEAGDGPPNKGISKWKFCTPVDRGLQGSHKTKELAGYPTKVDGPGSVRVRDLDRIKGRKLHSLRGNGAVQPTTSVTP